MNGTLHKYPDVWFTSCSGSECETDSQKIKNFYETFMIEAGYIAEEVDFEKYGQKPTRT